MATAKLKRKPLLPKIESYKAANILKKCSFASRFVWLLLIDTYPAAAARRSGRTCRLLWSDLWSTPLGAWVPVNAKTLGPQEGP